MTERSPYIRLHDTGEGLPRVLAAERPHPGTGTVYRVARSVAKTRAEAAACVVAFRRIGPEEVAALSKLDPSVLNAETRRTLAVEIEEAPNA